MCDPHYIQDYLPFRRAAGKGWMGDTVLQNMIPMSEDQRKVFFISSYVNTNGKWQQLFVADHRYQ